MTLCRRLCEEWSQPFVVNGRQGFSREREVVNSFNVLGIRGCKAIGDVAQGGIAELELQRRHPSCKIGKGYLLEILVL